MSDPARQCAMMQNTQLVSPPLFNIPTKCLKKKKKSITLATCLHVCGRMWGPHGLNRWQEDGAGGGAHQEASGAFLWCHA